MESCGPFIRTSPCAVAHCTEPLTGAEPLSSVEPGQQLWRVLLMLMIVVLVADGLLGRRVV